MAQVVATQTFILEIFTPKLHEKKNDSESKEEKEKETATELGCPRKLVNGW